jgi:hypothetical protein
MGWGTFLGGGALAVASYLGANRAAEVAEQQAANQAALQNNLLQIGAQGGADLEKAYIDELTRMGSLGKFDAGTYAGIQDAFYRRNMDAANSSLDKVSGQARAASLGKGLGSSTYDIELKKGLAETGAKLGQDAYFSSFDQANKYLGDLQGMRSKDLAEVATVVGGPASMRMGAPQAALGSATSMAAAAQQRAGMAASGFGSALSRTLDQSDKEYSKMWSDFKGFFG